MFRMKADNRPPSSVDDEKDVDQMIIDVLAHKGRPDDEVLVQGLVDDSTRKVNRILRQIGALPPSRAVWTFNSIVFPALRKLTQVLERIRDLRQDPRPDQARKAQLEIEGKAIHEYLVGQLAASLRRSSAVPSRVSRITMLWAQKDMIDAVEERYGSRRGARAWCELCDRVSYVDEWILAGTEKGAFIACPGCGRPDRLIFSRNSI